MADYSNNPVEIGLTAANNFLQGVGNAYAAASMDKRTREWNEKMAEEQRSWAEEMYNKSNAWNYERWLESNEYNSPAAQVARLREAGLNPLYYGLDGNSSGAMSDAAQPLGYERANATPFVNPISSGIDAALKVAQISNVQANTAKTGQETISEVQHREKVQTDIEKTKQELENLKSQQGLTESQKAEIDKRIDWCDRLNEATIAEKEANAALNSATKNRIDELLEGEKLLQAESLEDFEYKWSKIRAEIGKIAKETGVLQLDIENYALNHANNGFMGTGVSLQNLIRGGKSLGNLFNKNPKVQEGKSILAEDNR